MSVELTPKQACRLGKPYWSADDTCAHCQTQREHHAGFHSPKDVVEGATNKQVDESVTQFTVRAIQHDAWEKGYASGFSNAMRRMSDEPDAPTSPNPYADK